MSGHDDLAPISLREARLRRDFAASPWCWRLHMFVRAVAAIEFVKGISHWATLIGVGGAPFAAAATPDQVATIVFAVADPVAAVGLWLGAGWGVVIWLLAATGQMLFGALTPGGHGLIVAAEAIAMAAYLALSVLATREERRMERQA